MAESILPDDRLTLIVAGVRIEASAWEVPPSDEFPNGLKYSFQALDMDENHIERWDNTNDAHGARHHRHLPDGEIEPIENPPETTDDVQELLKEFIEEVTER
jgi:hypothetical protein